MEGGEHLYGDPAARFTLIEFGDVECPYCRRFHDTVREIIDAAAGRVNWRWKHLPLAFHDPAARREALAAECIAVRKGNRAFWVFLDELFRATRGGGGGVADLDSLAVGVGAERDAFRACLVSGRHEEKLRRDREEATALGITGTPATLIVDHRSGGRRLLGGWRSAQEIVGNIRAMMAEAEKTPSGKSPTGTAVVSPGKKTGRNAGE